MAAFWFALGVACALIATGLVIIIFGVADDIDKRD